MIDVKHLSKSFGDHLVLDDISEHIYPGDKVVIIGPSGSGKSTFLRSLNLLEPPTAGTITFDGIEITNPKTDIDEVRRQMGMVFQHFNLFPNMTILRNITLAPVRTGRMNQAQAEEQAMALLRRVGLEEKAKAYPSQLSGGQNQRRSSTSLEAVKAAMRLVKPGGVISLCIYSGGDTGYEEREVLLEWLKDVDPKKWLVLVNSYHNRKNDPPLPVFILRLE